MFNVINVHHIEEQRRRLAAIDISFCHITDENVLGVVMAKDFQTLESPSAPLDFGILIFEI